MTQTETIFFKILSAALWNRELGNISGVDWHAILKIAERMSVLPLVADVVIKNNCQGLTTAQIGTLQQFIYGSIRTHMKLNSVLFKVRKHLQDGGLKPVLLKGQGTATFYREPFLRQCGDIDLYIGQEYYQKAVDLMMQIVDNAWEEYSESDKHYHLRVDGIDVEIHKISARMADSALSGVYSRYEFEYLKSRTDTVKIMDEDIAVPEITFNLLFTFYHAWYHFMSGGLGIRQVCDITLLLESNFNRIDHDRFKEMLVSLDLMEPWTIFMYIAVEYLGLEREKVLFYDKSRKTQADKMLSMILIEGNFGHYKNDSFFIPKNSHWFFRKIRSLTLTTKRYIRLYKVSPKYTRIFYWHYLSTGLKALVNNPC